MGTVFFCYVLVGGVNTTLHWAIFFIALTVWNFDQASSNFAAFVVAASFSFFANSKLTFKSTATVAKYLSYLFFMGGMSLVTGYVADRNAMNPFATLVSFSAISLLVGFLYSRYIVFKERQ